MSMTARGPWRWLAGFAALVGVSGSIGLSGHASAQVNDAQLLLIYTSLQIGWQTNAHCKTLSTEQSNDFSARLTIINEAIERRLGAHQLGQAAQTARTVVPILGCTTERSKVVEDAYASARNLTEAPTNQ